MIRKNIILIISLLLCIGSVLAQKKITKVPLPNRPKLVVGIVVDQMRYDYLYRFYDKYSNGGFKRMMNEGYNCRNTHYHYALTVTAAGHSAIYTGSMPAINGIVGNDWYDQSLGRSVYCSEDTSVTTVGSGTTAGKMSPRNMLTTSICDQLRLGTNFQSKVVGVAIKDRGSILPAGHSANAAYWFDSKEGKWITSTYYMDELPAWVKTFNERKLPSQYLAKGWNTLFPIEQYTESTSDDQAYEGRLPGEAKPVFPHVLVGTSGDVFSVLASTPYGNTLTKDFALAALQNERLGKGQATDFLAVSFSSTDYVGHAFGPNSIEEEDTYLRLDRELEELFNFLDSWVGKGNYVSFLSADHGVMDVPGFWKQNKLPAGLLDFGKGLALVKTALNDTFGAGEYIRASENYQFYLNYKTLADKKISVQQVCEVAQATLRNYPGIADVVNLTDLGHGNLNSQFIELYKNLYNPQRTGDIGIVGKPGWFSGRSTGTTHGTPYAYDRHIPLLWYGWKIPKGQTSTAVTVADIAATLADLLSLLEPNGCIGHPIEDLMEKVHR